MIDKLIVDNFRPIKHIELNLKPFNILIGPNNVGKSSIISALNIILGEVWPSERSFNDRDFYNYIKDNEIKISVNFNPQIFDSNGNAFTRLNLSYGGIYQYGKSYSFVGITEDGNERYVSNEIRNEVSLMYIGLDRLAYQQLRDNKWTFYSKLMMQVNSEIDDEDKDRFYREVNTTYEKTIKQYIGQMEDGINTDIRDLIDLNIDMQLSLFDSAKLIENIRPKVIERQRNGEPVSTDLMYAGAGVQSAFAVALANAYSKFVRKAVILTIEEPELYLHPHGCRNFYNFLKKLANENLQIIYSTHSKAFVNIADFQDINIIRKPRNEETTIVQGQKIQIDENHRMKIFSKFDDEVNEVFFAEKVILVEGVEDKIACKLSLEQLDMDLDKKNISIIDCGGGGDITWIGEITMNFGIPTFFLVDNDEQKPQAGINKLYKKFDQNLIFPQKEKLEDMFPIPPQYLDKNGHFKDKVAAQIFFIEYYGKHNKVPKVYQELKDAIEK